MHGFFMDARLYQEAKAVADPFAYHEYRKQKIEKLLEDGTAKRIQLKKAARALPKVNKALAKRMVERDEVRCSFWHNILITFEEVRLFLDSRWCWV
jgi:ribosome biogenesis protein ENP2